MKFGIIGSPVEHSLSPRLFKAAFPEGNHTYDLIFEDDFNRAYDIFLEKYDAVNVTFPFKDLAYMKADAPSDAARRLGATNLLKKHNGKIYAFNSDYTGVKAILEEEFKSPITVMVIGSGGAGKAAALAAYDAGHNVTIANRNMERSTTFVRHANLAIKCIELTQIADYIKDTDLIIYTLPLAIDSLSRDMLKGKCVMEANYRDPVLTPENGEATYRYIDGGRWLQAQAVKGFEIMTATSL